MRYPDFELIEAEGVIIANDDPAGGDAGGVPEPDPQAGDMAGPSADPAVAECLDAGIPELDAGMELSGTWHTNVVAPLFSSEEAQRLDHDATGCLRQRLSASADELPDLNHFFAYVDSVMMHAGGATPSREQAATLVADWETTATDAFLACTPPYYDWFFAELEAARPEFVDQHREAIGAFAAELEPGATCCDRPTRVAGRSRAPRLGRPRPGVGRLPQRRVRRGHASRPAVDFVDHDPHPSFAGTIDGVINSTEMLRRDGLAVQFGLVDLFAVGDRIAYRVGAKGTQRNGAGISVEIFTLANTGIFRVEDGVLAERWGAWSYTQLGQS